VDGVHHAVALKLDPHSIEGRLREDDFELDHRPIVGALRQLPQRPGAEPGADRAGGPLGRRRYAAREPQCPAEGACRDAASSRARSRWSGSFPSVSRRTSPCGSWRCCRTDERSRSSGCTVTTRGYASLLGARRAAPAGRDGDPRNTAGSRPFAHSRARDGFLKNSSGTLQMRPFPHPDRKPRYCAAGVVCVERMAE
jgi:hypothetical protein